MKIRCLIVDDEPLALDVLENYISRLDTLELVTRCNNAIEAFNILKQQSVDLIFLDIQMPQLTGMEFLRSLENPPKIIFTTAYRDYAVEGYELNALDYLLKPISFDRFLKAVNKIPELQTEAVNPLTTQPSTGYQQEPFIYLKADKRMVRILLRDIIYIESLKDYVRVKIENSKEVVAYQKISYLEEKLPDDRFFRIHRSFIIALDKVTAFSATQVDLGKFSIPIGRNYKTQTLERLNADNLLDE